MPKEKELEEELDDEIIQEALLEDELFSDEDQEEESSKLDKKEVLSLIGIATFAFFIFSFFIFPLNEIVRSLLVRMGKETKVLLDAKEIHFPLFGRKSFDSFVVNFPTGTNLKSEEISLGISLFGLLQSKVEGDAEIGYLKFEGSEWGFTIQTLNLVSKLSGVDEPLSRWSGEGEIELFGGKIVESIEIPFLGTLKNTEVKKANLSYKIRNSKLLIERGSLDSSLAKFQFQGVIRLSDVISASQLDLKICFTLNERFANERQDLTGMLALLPSEGGKTCVPVRGTFSSPKVDLPNLNPMGTNSAPEPGNIEPIKQ
ncbi:type II secretion system protein GspN [Leptospira sp. 96542]|nr:type II secretion system protein GspN [Leptospira sp. 96542]